MAELTRRHLRPKPPTVPLGPSVPGNQRTPAHNPPHRITRSKILPTLHHLQSCNHSKSFAHCHSCIRSLLHGTFHLLLLQKLLARKQQDSGLPKPTSLHKAIMPLQLLLDISTASARSKGQARRRNQPTASEHARKAQRNLARRERAKCKKAGETQQQLL